MKKHKEPIDLWPLHTPPETLEQVGQEINVSICKAALSFDIDHNTENHGLARRGCGDVWSRAKSPALLYATVCPDAWERVRDLGPEPPDDDGDRCLWLLAAAWRAVQWLDHEKLVQKQLHMIRRFVTYLKAGVGSLPSGFVIEAEETLREDELERKKPAGPGMKAATAKKTTRVVH